MKTTSTKKKSTVEIVEIEKEQNLSEINIEQLQNIFQNMPAATAIFKGHEHKYILANTAYEKLANRKTADLLGQNLCEVFPELTGTGTIELFDNVFKTGETFNAPEFAAMLDLKNEGVLRQCYFNFSINPLKNDSGEIYGVIVMFYEISEQIEARKKIEESEKRYNKMLMQSPFAFAILKGKDMVLVMANDSIKQMWGKGNEIEGKPLIEILPELKDQEFPALLHKVFTTGIPHVSNEALARMKRKGKMEDVYFNFVYQPYREADDTISGVTIIAIEVTNEVIVKKIIEESEQRFRMALAGSTQIVFSQDKNLKHTWIYNAHPDFKAEDIVGKSDNELHVPATARILTDIKQKTLNTGKAYNGELEIELGGQVVNYAMHIETIKDAEENVTGIIGTGIDITERIKTHKKLEETEKQQSFLLKLSDALRSLDNPVDIEEAVTKIAMDFMDADRCYYCIIEEGNAIIQRDAVRGDLPSIAGVYPISNNPLFKTLMDAGGPFIVDDVHTTTILDEELKQLCLQLQLISFINVPFIKNGKPVGVLSLLQSKPRKWTDIEMQLTIETAERTWAAVERAKAEQALRQSEEKYRTLFVSIDQGYVLCELVRNKEGKGIDYYMLEVNPTYEKQSGLSKEMMLGKTILQVFPTIDKWHIDAYAAVVDNQSPVVFEQYFEVNHRWHEVKVYPSEKEKFTVLFRDITERKLFEKELIDAKVSAENATKSKQQFLSNMSHEIRTPLNSILGFTNVLLKTELGVEQKEFVQAIKTSGKSLNLLINDILDLAKVDSGKMTFEKQPFEIHKSITSILHSFDLKIKEKNLELIKEYDTQIPSMLCGDSLKLNQIILNLISNAVKFTHQGKIKLSVKLLSETEENVTLEFTVTDTGIGIADNKLNSIFNIFEQAEISTSTSYGGTGLGLAIVKQLIEAQGASINVRSKLGEGSTFSFILPFGKTNIKFEEKIETLKSNSEIKNLRVLVAEDVALNQLLIKMILSDFGFEYEIVSNGKIAIEKLQTNTYDIVLMDLQMPEMNGYEATEYIRKTLKSHIPIIALTADVTTMDVSKCKEFGMDDYISKPINENLLYSKIVELVKKKQ